MSVERPVRLCPRPWRHAAHAWFDGGIVGVTTGDGYDCPGALTDAVDFPTDPAPIERALMKALEGLHQQFDAILTGLSDRDQIAQVQRTLGDDFADAYSEWVEDGHR